MEELKTALKKSEWKKVQEIVYSDKNDDISEDLYTEAIIFLMGNYERDLLDFCLLKININNFNNANKSRLMWSSNFNSNTAVTLSLIDNGIDINQVNCNGDTLLMRTIECGNKVIIDKLLDVKCDVDIISKTERTALMEAIINSLPDIALRLIDLNCNIFNEDIWKKFALSLSLEKVQDYKNYPDIKNKYEQVCIKLIDKYIDNKNLSFLEFPKYFDGRENPKYSENIIKFMYEHKQIEKIWSLYNEIIKNIINNKNNIMSVCFNQNLGDINIISMVTKFLY
ncbi:MAG: hypothetical protein Edafosvirus7_19 [Edafosvirus sp.]|uniref:Uncharacterized protein n=1 Tax=Edafosvirus sp. TaxID=2487765 RepID=A0A3G4ZTL5_9VIRU|nr:MAG: hypothetical protein Edafosvirus7_19 [Edafosvirus sp.]